MSAPKHCGVEMWEVKDRADNNKPVYWCPECHAKLPRVEVEKQK